MNASTHAVCMLRPGGPLEGVKVGTCVGNDLFEQDSIFQAMNGLYLSAEKNSFEPKSLEMKA